MKLGLFVVTLLLILGGCNGLMASAPPLSVQDCVTHCEAWGMNLVGMVQVGRHADGCICAVPGECMTVGQTAAAVIGDGVAQGSR